MKKILFILILFLFFAVVSYVVYQRREPVEYDSVTTLSAPTPTLEPPSVAQNPPEVSFVEGAPRNVEFSLGAPLPSPPPSFSVYRATFAPNTREIVVDFARSLGFAEPSNTRTQEGVTIMSWQNDTLSLSFIENGPIRSLSYVRQKVSSSEQALPPEKAAEALINLFPSPSTITAKMVRQEYVFSPEGGGFKDGGRLSTGVLYQYLLNDVPLLLVNFDPNSVWAGLDQKGVARSFTLTVSPSELTHMGERAPLSLDNAVRSLNSGKGLLLSVENEPGLLYGSKPNFTSVILMSLKYGYYFEEKTGLLLPVYLFDGFGLTSEGRQSVRYFLRATD